MTPETPAGLEGLRVLPGYLAPAEQKTLCDWLLALPDTAFFTPTMPRSGQPFSVRMTNLGSLGWVSDRHGYRYAAHHPLTGAPWPPIPEPVMRVWREVAAYPAEPEACLVNYYNASARMGLHRDADEDAKDAPVVSLSLGDTALFRVGGQSRRGPTRSVRLASGDVAVLGGAARAAYHGIDRVLPGTSRLLPGGGRFNLTLRRVRLP